MRINELINILKLETIGGDEILYRGYVEINLKFSEIKSFNEDVLMLVIEGSSYKQRVLIQLWMLHIDRALELVNKDELHKLSASWCRHHLTTLLPGKL